MKNLLFIALSAFAFFSFKISGIDNLKNAINVTGKYKTDFGILSLTQKENALSGKYHYPSSNGEINGSLKGELNSLTAKFTWEQLQDGKKVSGEGKFIFSSDGKSFKGTWKDNAGKAGTWNGTKSN